MHQSLRCVSRVSSVWVAFVAGLLAAAQPRPAGAVGDAIVVEVESVDGGIQRGSLEAIDQESIRLTGEQGTRSLPVATVRTVTRVGNAPASSQDVRVTCADGATLSGTDLALDGETLSLARPEGPIRLPVARVRTIVLNRPTEKAAADGEPEWIRELPEKPDADIVAVAKGDEIQFVDCAIVGISSDKVTVVLDGETIPVKRDRVVGLHWLREPAVAAGIAVRVAGGELSAARVAWTADGLLLDAMQFPADAIVGIDYASARTVRLATLETERLEVEPFFGGLAGIEGLDDYFRPRAVGGGMRKDLVVHPRTVAVWRVPAGSRSFTTSLSPWSDAGGGGSVVSIAIDDREARRIPVDRATAGSDGRIAVEAIPLDNARRLSIIVDYGSAGPVGGSVLFHDPVFTR